MSSDQALDAEMCIKAKTFYPQKKSFHLIGVEAALRHDIRTVADCSPGDLPQDQAQGPDVHPLIGLEAVHLDGVVKHFGSHVALRAHFGIVPHIQLIGVLKMHDGQP